MPAVPPPEVRVRVPGKVNLHLGVGAVRPDRFHELVTVFHAVDVCDVVTVRPAGSLTVRMTGAGASELPTGPDNLAWRAAERLAAHAAVPPAVAIEIDKAIPVAGGMAGGSADAAATLVACAELWGVPRSELAAVAVELGSDVTFPLLGGTAVGTGRGEVLTPLPTAGSLHWVFVRADFGISAGDAYRELDRLRAGGAMPRPALDADAMCAALASGDPERVAAVMHNDLEPASRSLAPSLDATLAAGRAAGALGGVVSGSGPTCAFLCADAVSAALVAAAFGPDRAQVARGPVPGATVLDVTGPDAAVPD